MRSFSVSEHKDELMLIRAAVALQRKDPSRAIELLQVVGDMELANIRLLPAYFR